MRRKYEKSRRRKSGMPFLLLLFLCGFLLTLLSLWQLEKKFMPPLREMSHMQSKAVANEIIDRAAENALQELQLSAESLLIRSEDSGVPSYAADTAQINRFCTLLSRSASQSLAALPKEAIRIPLGAATNIASLANRGPELTFTLLPQGIVDVDYETSFESVGINQINYKIWITISVDIKIVNPLYQETLSMQRKFMLVDLVFGGKVPEYYFQMGQRDEYVLTE
ncbi:MAG: hypothetical protein HFE61_04970 [Anaerotignum sp.]|nr:hypothetical protein [Anaerotignum sp.]MCI8867486.1 hypothetical protein [Anaerotignum sp.]